MTTEEVLSRWVDTVYPSKEALKQELEKRKLKIYLGADPTGPELHLGHSTNLLLLRHFQRLGHQIIFLVGDATALIGDPSGRETARRPLTREEVRRNARTYQRQVGKILRFGWGGARLEFNSRWWGRMGFLEGLKLSYFTTVNQLIERDMFQKRLKKGGSISPAELLYPFMQGYDSVIMGVDAEVGGTDQTFNMLMGRELAKKIRGKEKFVITTKLLENPKTGQKLMNKSTGSYIPITLPAREMFGSVMALPDEAVIPCFELCTEVSSKALDQFRRDMLRHPAEVKKSLAFEITRIYHGSKAAIQAFNEFETVFSKGGAPTDLPTWRLAGKEVVLADLLTKKKIISSRSEVRRLLAQGAIRLNNQKLTADKLVLRKGILKIGRRIFVKIE